MRAARQVGRGALEKRTIFIRGASRSRLLSDRRAAFAAALVALPRRNRPKRFTRRLAATTRIRRNLETRRNAGIGSRRAFRARRRIKTARPHNPTDKSGPRYACPRRRALPPCAGGHLNRARFPLTRPGARETSATGATRESGQRDGETEGGGRSGEEFPALARPSAAIFIRAPSSGLCARGPSRRPSRRAICCVSADVLALQTIVLAQRPGVIVGHPASYIVVSSDVCLALNTRSPS